MPVVYPNYDRAIIEEDGDSLRITIPVAKLLFATVFLVTWLIAWAAIVAFGIRALFRGKPIEGEHFGLPWATEETTTDFTFFMLQWNGIMAIVYICFILGALWYFAGKEIIEIDSRTLRRIRQIPLFRHTEQYSMADVANLRLSSDIWLPSWLPAQRVPFMTFRGGRIAFDCGGSTHRLGLELSDADTERVIDAMRRHTKSHGPTSLLV